MFVDYSDPLGGVLSWIADLQQGFELTLVGIVTEAARVEWADRVDADAPAALLCIDPREVAACEDVRSPAELPPAIAAAIDRVDVFFPNAYETGYRLAALARRLAGTGAVVSFTHADEAHYYYLARTYAPLISKFFVADTPSERGVAVQVPARIADIVRLPHGMALPEPFDRRPRRDLLRVLYVGRVVARQKRIFDLVPLAIGLRRRGVPFTLDVVGEGEDRPELEARAALEAPEIRCLGLKRRHEVLELYRAYDVLVMCSEFEGMSVALMEAMAHGVVPVVTNVGGAVDLIVNEAEGFTWPVGDLEGAAERVAALWRDPRVLASCSVAARGRIAEHHAPAAALVRMREAVALAAGSPNGSAEDAGALLADKRRSPYFPEG